MGKYYVEVPVLMKLTLEIEAENKDEAVDKMWQADICMTPTTEKEDIEVLDYEWDMYEKVVEGNVYHGTINGIYVSKSDD